MAWHQNSIKVQTCIGVCFLKHFSLAHLAGVLNSFQSPLVLCPVTYNTGSSKTSWISPLPSFIQQKSWVPPLFPQHIPWPQGTYTGSRWMFSVLSYQLELFRHLIVLQRRLLWWEFSLFIDFLGGRARFSVRRPKVHMMYDMFKP